MKRPEIDMCSGPLSGKILEYSLPLMATGILQLLFTSADTIVVGRYAGSTAMAAVGSTAQLISLIINLFIGLSIGSGVMIARHFGAGDKAAVGRALHTSLLISAVCGITVSVVGIFMSRTFLEMMKSPADVIDQAELYLKIYFIGVPAMLIYNFAAAAMRAVGDTRRPLIYLMSSGLLNVILNLLFVAGFRWDVAGVAASTAISQFTALFLFLRALKRESSAIRLDISLLRMDKRQCMQIIRIGLPAGLQGMIFSLSNVLIQSSINSFGSAAMAANTASVNIEDFSYMVMNAFSQAALTFVSQNYGAKKYARIGRIFVISSLWVMVTGLLLSGLCYLFAPQLLRLYTEDPAVIEMGRVRLFYVGLPHLLCGMMEIGAAMMRGIGYSVTPMIVSMLGACGLRVAWLYTVFAANPTLVTLYISYPVSWLITTIVHLICFAIVWRRSIKPLSLEESQPVPGPVS